MAKIKDKEKDTLMPKLQSRQISQNCLLCFRNSPISISIKEASSGRARGSTPGSLKLVLRSMAMTKRKRRAAKTGMAGDRWTARYGHLQHAKKRVKLQCEMKGKSLKVFASIYQSVCMSVCLSVNKITIWFEWKFQEMLVMGQGIKWLNFGDVLDSSFGCKSQYREMSDLAEVRALRVLF